MENERTNEINIMDIIFILRKNIIFIVCVALILAIASYAYTVTSVVPLYRSSTHMLIKALTSDAMTVYSDSTSRIMLVNNCIEVLSGNEVMLSVIDKLELDMEPEQLQNAIVVSSPADTQVLKIAVTHPNPKTAKNIAVEMVSQAEEVLARDVGVAALSVFQEAKIPTSPVSPNPIKNTVMGGFLGAFLASALVLLIRLINNKIYTAEDVERVLGAAVLASIPVINENTTTAPQNENENSAESKQ